MNIRQVLLQDKIHNRDKAIEIAQYACASHAHMQELMQCFLNSEYRLAQRAAWSVGWAAKQKPAMVQPYVKELVAQLQRKDVSAAIIRNSVRVLQMVTIPKACHAAVMNACFQFIEQPATPVAIKAFSLTTLNNLSKYYPEIKQELELIIRARWDHETAAFKSRAKKIIGKSL